MKVIVNVRVGPARIEADIRAINPAQVLREPSGQTAVVDVFPIPVEIIPNVIDVNRHTPVLFPAASTDAEWVDKTRSRFVTACAADCAD
jgi:hypothetical protein